MTQIQGLIVGYSTEGEVKGCHVVCHGEAVGSVKQATAATDKLLGVSTRVTTHATEHTDVVRSGLAPVTYGDTVKRGRHTRTCRQSYKRQYHHRFCRRRRRSR